MLRGWGMSGVDDSFQLSLGLIEYGSGSHDTFLSHSRPRAHRSRTSRPRNQLNSFGLRRVLCLAAEWTSTDAAVPSRLQRFP